MIPKWNLLLREKINETSFIFAKYQNHDSKDQWNCITSCMDWIDVGATNINQALDELNRSQGLETCMKFYQYICCIDIVWGGICQLHRVFINRDTIPFENDSSVFQMKCFNEDDNRYFEEIRSCFGAHPVELKPKQSSKKKKGERKFASWSGHFGSPDTMSVLIYSNIPNPKLEEVVVTIDELKKFYEKRYQYIKVIIDAIDSSSFNHEKEMKNSAIPKSNDPIEQITILKNASQQRFGGGVLIEELEQIERFLTTDFSCEKNKGAVEAFRQKIAVGITEIYDCFQNMNIDCDLEIEKLLLPQYLPRGNNFGCEFANLHSKAILKLWKTYDIKSIKQPLEKYIYFDYKTEDELYWLTVIALNMAQEDLKEDSQRDNVDIDSVLNFIETISKTKE